MGLLLCKDLEVSPSAISAGRVGVLYLCSFFLYYYLQAVNLPQDPLLDDAAFSLKQSGVREEARLRLLVQFILTLAHTSWTIKGPQEHSCLHCTFIFSAKAFSLYLSAAAYCIIRRVLM